MLAAAEQNMLVIVDGFICTAAAMLAVQINENVKEIYWKNFSNKSTEIKMKKE